MKPLLLHGHERAITQIKYNREGDLLFSCSKDKQPNVWYSLNGERLGTLDGHNGTVWSIDVSWDTTKVVTGAADQRLKLWDCQTGTAISTIDTMTGIRSCNFSYGGQMVIYSTDYTMKRSCEITIVDSRKMVSGEPEPIMQIPVEGSKVTSSQWGPLDEYIVTGHENGDIIQWDLRMGKALATVRAHSEAITDLQINANQSLLISACKDHTAKLFDLATLDHMKTYKTDRPVNSAAISPIRDHVVLGGGQEARDVTTTSTRAGKFEARFFHLIFEEEFGRIKGHFGPINSVCFHPDGRSYSSGGEDGYIRVHHFDLQYFDFQFEH